MKPAAQPVAAQYCANFLKPEMEHIYRQIGALRAYQPAVITQKRENARRFPFSPVIILKRPWTREFRRFWQKTILRGQITLSRKEVKMLTFALKDSQADVLHIYFGHIGVQLLPYLRRAKMPVVVSFHGADAAIDHAGRSHVRRMRQVFNLVELVLCRSQAIADHLSYIGCPSEKLRLHRTGIPLDRFPFSQRYAPDDGHWRLFQACRLIPKKGIETTLRAFARFLTQYPLSKLTIAGEGPLLDTLQDLAHDLRIAARVNFPGFVSQSRLRELFYQSHMFLHPSVTTPEGDREGVPNAMLEAMASGLPAVATWHGGIPEAVRHGENGLLSAEHSDEELAESMLWLAAQPNEYSAMSAEAGRSIADYWEIGKQTRLLENLYDEARSRFS